VGDVLGELGAAVPAAVGALAVVGGEVPLESPVEIELRSKQQVGLAVPALGYPASK
jgi:hypothetical protein